MERLFRIDFYPHEWLTGTGSLTPEECGVYIQIVSLIYARRGPIPNDPDEIARKLKGCSTRLARAIIQRLVDKEKITIQGGFIAQKRAELELNDKRTHLENSSNGGRTKAENERRRKENKDLVSSGRPSALSSSYPTVTVKEESKNPPTPLPSVFHIDPHFSPVWNSYPGRGKDGARGEAYKGRKAAALEIFREMFIQTKEENRGNFVESVVAGCIRYAGFLDATGSPGQSCANWLKDRGWEDDYSSTPAEPRRDTGYSLGTVAQNAMADKTGNVEGRKERLASLGIDFSEGNEG